MESTIEKAAFERAAGPVLQLVLPDKAEVVLNVPPDPKLQKRIEELADKSTEGELSEDERNEYTGYVRANKFIAILQRQVRRLTSLKTNFAG